MLDYVSDVLDRVPQFVWSPCEGCPPPTQREGAGGLLERSARRALRKASTRPVDNPHLNSALCERVTTCAS